ncbi:hypothetical protein [Stenotrophomonas sp.]|uniref:hypothetical protein n=1 Tax=Stenotrophomonas sp. TaxID=69392 RepID=UPI0028AE4635|nr:hypothetical protein [Stenotrophomonas sp.]
MNLKCMLPIGLLLLCCAVAEAQAADKTYECVVKDSAGKRLLHTTDSGLINKTVETYTAAAADAIAAESVAIAVANKEHSNKAVSACCIERPATVQRNA